MDKRRSINTKLWSDEWVESLSTSQKLLWVYFLTNTQTNMLGIYEISIKRICFETGLDDSTVLLALSNFEKAGRAYYWFGSLVLPNWLKNQAMNNNMKKSAETLYSQLRPDILKKLQEHKVQSFLILSKDLKPSETLSKIEMEEEKGNLSIEQPDKNKNTFPENSLSNQDRKQCFINEVVHYKAEYGGDVLGNFIGYWVEPDQSGKMRFELEKVWDTKLRLRRWKDDTRK